VRRFTQRTRPAADVTEPRSRVSAGQTLLPSGPLMRLLVLSRNASLYSTSRIVLAARARGHRGERHRPARVPDRRLARQALAPRRRRRRPSLRRRDPAHRREHHQLRPRRRPPVRSHGRPRAERRRLHRAQPRQAARAAAAHAQATSTSPSPCARAPPRASRPRSSLVGGCPAIVKLQQGTQGIGTMIAETPQAVRVAPRDASGPWARTSSCRSTSASPRAATSAPSSIGGRVVAAMRRVAKPGEFRSNLHRGAKGNARQAPAAHLPQRRRPRDEGDGPGGRGRRHARGQETGRRSWRSTAPRASRASSARAASTWPARSSARRALRRAAPPRARSTGRRRAHPRRDPGRAPPARDAPRAPPSTTPARSGKRRLAKGGVVSAAHRVHRRRGGVDDRPPREPQRHRSTRARRSSARP
jgi:hypothetical protein